MNNGQLNIASVPSVTPFVTQATTVPVVATKDGEQQAGGAFAGVLSGIQHVAKDRDLPDSGLTEQVSIKIGKHQLHLNAGAEEPNVDLLAQLLVSPEITPVPGPAVSKQEKPEQAGMSTDTVQLVSEPPDIALQMAMAGNLHTGRMPEVNIPTPRAVDSLQNGAFVTVLPADISVSAGKGHPEQAFTEPQQAPHVTGQVQLGFVSESAPAFTPQPAVSDRMSDVSRQAPLPADRLQNVASATEQTALFQAVTAHQTLAVTEPIPASQGIAPAQPGLTKESAPASSSQPAASDRMSDASQPTPRPVDRLQNVARATDQPVLFSTPAVTVHQEQTVIEPIPAPQVITPVQPGLAKSAPASSSQPTASDRRSDVNHPAPLPVDRLQNVASATAHQDVPAPILSPESELEIQLSQPQPITARATDVSAVAGNRSAGLVHEIHGGRQQPLSEQQIEKVRSGNEQTAVKEMATSLLAESSTGESLGNPDTQRDSDSNQGQSEGAVNNRMLAQEMPGQLSTEHQKTAAVTTKMIPTEPARQDLPEQVMQQVKERLVQHDVKPGNQQITLTLSPDSLGELKMNLNLQGQKLSVEIITENRTVRDAIVLHTDALKESLARQNITMESFDVTTSGKGSGNQSQNQNAWRELAKQQNQQQLWTSQRGYHTAQADLPSGHVFQRQQGQAMLDIHY